MRVSERVREWEREREKEKGGGGRDWGSKRERGLFKDRGDREIEGNLVGEKESQTISCRLKNKKHLLLGLPLFSFERKLKRIRQSCIWQKKSILR